MYHLDPVIVTQLVVPCDILYIEMTLEHHIGQGAGDKLLVGFDQGDLNLSLTEFAQVFGRGRTGEPAPDNHDMPGRTIGSQTHQRGAQSSQCPHRTHKPTSTNHLSVLPVNRKSTRLNSSHVAISYAVFCLKK